MFEEIIKAAKELREKRLGVVRGFSSFLEKMSEGSPELEDVYATILQVEGHDSPPYSLVFGYGKWYVVDGLPEHLANEGRASLENRWESIEIDAIIIHVLMLRFETALEDVHMQLKHSLDNADEARAEIQRLEARTVPVLAELSQPATEVADDADAIDSRVVELREGFWRKAARVAPDGNYSAGGWNIHSLVMPEGSEHPEGIYLVEINRDKRVINIVPTRGEPIPREEFLTWVKNITGFCSDVDKFL